MNYELRMQKLRASTYQEVPYTLDDSSALHQLRHAQGQKVKQDQSTEKINPSSPAWTFCCSASKPVLATFYQEVQHVLFDFS